MIRDTKKLIYEAYKVHFTGSSKSFRDILTNIISQQSNINNNYQIIKNLKAGKIISAVRKQPKRERSWLEWAYTTKGGSNNDFLDMIVCARNVTQIDDIRQYLDKYKTTEKNCIFTQIDILLDSKKKMLLSRSYLGGNTGQHFFLWLDAEIDKIAGKQTNINNLSKNIALISAINYRHMSLGTGKKPFFHKSSICDMLNISRYKYNQDCEHVTQKTFELCETVDTQSLSCVEDEIYTETLLSAC